jgi:purine catabolism regulator
MAGKAPIRVRDFAEDPGLGLEVISGGDLDRQVSWVHVTELLDPSPYLQGGEFILSAGIWGPRGGRVEAFVGALVGSDVAALGWGLLSESGRVPARVIRACAAAELTLLAVPRRTPFIAVGRRFFEYVQSQREANLRATISRHERLVEAIAGLPGGLAGLLEVLRENVPHHLWVLDAAGTVRAASTPAAPPAPDEAAAGFDITASGHVSARLVVGSSGESLDAEQRASIRQALPLLGFVLAHEQELREAERRLATELVEGILSQQTRFSEGRLEAYGLDPRGVFVGVVVTPGGSDPTIRTAQQALLSLGGDAVAANWRETVTAIFQPARGEPSVEELGRSLYDALGAGFAVGVGGAAEGVEGIRRSLIQARQAASLAGRGRYGGYATYERAGSHELLLALQDEAVLASFCDSVLGPLAEHDARRGTELLPTLETFLSSGGRWQETADSLHIHVNTLRHRLTRCEELTNRDLSSMPDRVDLYLALRAWSARER